MKKRIISLALAMAMCFSLSITAFALENINMNEYTFTVSEYDALLAHRGRIADTMSRQGYSDSQILSSIAYEEERYLSNLATLPEETLKSEYGYSDEQISILKDYDGSDLALNPRMEAVLGEMNGSIYCMLASTKSMRVRLNWQWSSYPTFLNKTDMIAFSWVAINPSAYTINLRCDESNSSVTINYYDSTEMTYSHSSSPSLEITETYLGGYVDVPRMNNGCFAKQGNVILEVDVPSTTNANIAEANFRFAFGMEVRSVDFSYSAPLGLSIDFNDNAVELFNEAATYDCEGTLQ